MQNILLTIVGILMPPSCDPLIMLFSAWPQDGTIRKEPFRSEGHDALCLTRRPDEDVSAFGDTHFDYNIPPLTDEAKTLLDKDVQVLKEKPNMKVRMAGYTSAQRRKRAIQKLSETKGKCGQELSDRKGIAAGENNE